MKQKKQFGFTLIELLVVIAIIGILASIVLVSFPSATKKAKDSRVKSAVSQARTVMTYYYSNQGSYASFASTNAEMIPLAEEAKKNGYNSSKGEGFIIRNSTSGTGTCMYVVLNEKDGTTYYCADYIGRAGVAGATGIASCNNLTITSCGTGLTD